ncbi:hypothetical protein FHR83_008933 [Actinoplanes campanulatus]|uniref:Uncharacterized protein n=1 Tax=Actinoplanes campanulatus TaxID=113559 RepID=A0A7W5AS02_9ACTN|nr:hypothetical protein [Actinoplanes campanulatus]MBB3101205.1 hypothetical protein [Actinoplanes campanulatus]
MMLTKVWRHLRWRRVKAARVWRDAERIQAAEHAEAVRRILAAGPWPSRSAAGQQQAGWRR